MKAQNQTIVLGSASPRRRELMQLLLPADGFRILPPRVQEVSFDAARTRSEIENLLRENVSSKQNCVLKQLQESGESCDVLISADTVVVVTADDGSQRCLGKPPEPDWEPAVTQWFNDFYIRRPHSVLTCFAIQTAAHQHIEIVETLVTFRSDAMQLLPWYLRTEEPRGKAGGYAIQGAGSVFAETITGSLSNVVGLPLEQVLPVFVEAGLPGITE